LIANQLLHALQTLGLAFRAELRLLRLDVALLRLRLDFLPCAKIQRLSPVTRLRPAPVPLRILRARLVFFRMAAACLA